MLPDRVSNSGPLTYESGALPIALRGPAIRGERRQIISDVRKEKKKKKKKKIQNQHLQLCTARTAFSDSVVRSAKIG